jgi:hypothetical protein
MNSTRDTAKYVVAIYNQTSNESGDKKAKSFSSALTGLAYKMLIPVIFMFESSGTTHTSIFGTNVIKNKFSYPMS